MNTPSRPFSRLLSNRDLSGLNGRAVAERASGEERAAIAAAYDLVSLDRLDVEARVQREGKEGWRVDGHVRAELRQRCVVTLDPVAQSISEPFTRRFQPMTEEEARESGEITLDLEEDDPPEPLGHGIDIGEIALESFTLALDSYPRAPGAVFETAPEDEAEARPRPFAALAALKQGGSAKE